MANTLSDETEIKTINGYTNIRIYGTGDQFSLFFDNEQVGDYLTYTEALNKAITIVNEIG